MSGHSRVEILRNGDCWDVTVIVKDKVVTSFAAKGIVDAKKKLQKIQKVVDTK